MKAFICMLALTAGNVAAQYIFHYSEPDLICAFERSYFQIVAILCYTFIFEGK